MTEAMRVDPAARTMQRGEGEWRIWLGWMAAALLHGGLLAALIFSWPARLGPAPPDAAAVSLLIVPASGRGAVPPKPPAEAAMMPPAPAVNITNAPIVPKVAPRVASRSASLHLPRTNPVIAAPRGVVETRTAEEPGGDGFVAARPVAGSGNQPPEYPDEARAHGEQGYVLLSVHVLANGEADSVSVTQSSGYAVLDRAAAAAVWKWRFQPSTLSGRPVPSVISCPIHFSLQDAN